MPRRQFSFLQAIEAKSIETYQVACGVSNQQVLALEVRALVHPQMAEGKWPPGLVRLHGLGGACSCQTEAGVVVAGLERTWSRRSSRAM